MIRKNNKNGNLKIENYRANDEHQMAIFVSALLAFREDNE